ncbi:uncharacterized protein LOC100374291 [Saccoglossus kowalevskii]|uniref:RNMT-activating mini protein-like n=1 Tax=Saccoglossus kowalevskii TaxID=10224 RepID=A0ABM0GYD1_SACKO|nr:PREDICTED: RNMT-activating mini protein-like [Saccoglossus kowalevskii]
MAESASPEKRRERERSYSSDSSDDYVSKASKRNAVIVEHFNELFLDRFTETDKQYQEYVKRGSEAPPILQEYEKPRRLYYTPFSRNFRDQRFGGGGRRFDDRYRGYGGGGGGRYYGNRSNYDRGYQRRDSRDHYSDRKYSSSSRRSRERRYSRSYSRSRSRSRSRSPYYRK